MCLGYVPHASEKLNQTTVCESGTNDNVRLSDTASTKVNEREDEGGEGEGAQTEGCRVGELAVGNGLVETGLEFTTESRKTNRFASVDVCQRVTAVVVGLALLHGAKVGRCVVVAVDTIQAIEAIQTIGLFLHASIAFGVDSVLLLCSRHVVR